MTTVLVRLKKVSRPIGTIVDVFKGREPVEIGAEVEISAPDGEPLNIAKITAVYEKDGDEYMTLEMIA